MDNPSSSFRALAHQLLSLEAERGVGGGGQPHEAVLVSEKLRVSLSRFAGPEGFASLMRRSLVLARADAPALEAVTINPDGSLEGLESFVSATPDGGPEAVVGIIAHLLGLLVTFIGEPLTLRLVREAWPDASLRK